MSKNNASADGVAKLATLGTRATTTSDALRALSHEHRLMILCLLNGQERSVGELEQILQLPQPAVSQQLARLRLDNLVESRRDGRTIYYTTDNSKLEAIWRDIGLLLGYIGEEKDEAALAEDGVSMPMGVINGREEVRRADA